MVLSCYRKVWYILKKKNNQNEENVSEQIKILGINPSLKKKHYFEKYAPSELTDSYRILSTPSSFAKETLFYIQEIGKLKSLKSHISKREALDSFLFIIVASGSGTFNYNGKVYALKSGDHLFIDCKKPYSHESPDSDPWELTWVHFNSILMNQYFMYFSSKSASIVFRPQNPSEFNEILENLMKLANKKSTDSELLASHMLNSLVTKVLINNEDPNTKDVNTIDDKIQQIKDFLDKNFQKKIPLISLPMNSSSVNIICPENSKSIWNHDSKLHHC